MKESIKVAKENLKQSFNSKVSWIENTGRGYQIFSQNIEKGDNFKQSTKLRWIENTGKGYQMFSQNIETGDEFKQRFDSRGP